MVKVQLNVNKKCIANGVAGECEECPIALAAVAAGLNCVRVNGGIGTNAVSFVGSDGNVYGLKLPKVAVKFVSDFDMQEYDDILSAPIKPFKFVISIPNRIAKLLKLKKKNIVTALPVAA